MQQGTPKVKICGLTRLSDAQLACSLGAWTIGMVFFQGSPRRCSFEQAQLISRHLRRSVELCGVFVNAPLQEIAALSEELHLSIVQLHGDEGPSFCAEVARRTGAKVCKAAQVSGPGDLRSIERFHVDYHLLDARATAGAYATGSKASLRLRGGTGETFDWSLLAEGSPSRRRSKVPLILSGGLRPENVREAISIVRPFAVDTASGTESSPGVKDEQLLSAFFDAVRAAGAAAGAGIAA